MTDAPGDLLLQSLESTLGYEGPGDPLALRIALRERSGIHTLKEMLLDVPTHYDAWSSETDIRHATSAARRIEAASAKAERLGIEPEYTSRYQADLVDSLVFLGGYFRSSHDVDALRAYYGMDLPDLGAGDLTTPHGVVPVLRIPPECSGPGAHLWTLAQLSWDAEDRKPMGHSRFAVAQRLSEVIPRWEGLTLALSVCRLLGTAAALDKLSALSPPEAQRFIHVLALVHTPQTHAVAAGVTSYELDEAIAWLHGEAALAEQAQAETDPGSPEIRLPEARMIKGHEAAEVYAAEVLVALGFHGVTRTPPGADGGIDVIGRGIVAQVKMEALPTSRDRLQALLGAATVERSAAAFFSLAGYTAQALVWADRAEMALFEFEFDGSLTAVNATARHLLANGASI